MRHVKPRRRAVWKFLALNAALVAVGAAAAAAFFWKMENAEVEDTNEPATEAVASLANLREREAVKRALGDPGENARFRHERQSAAERGAWCGEVAPRGATPAASGFRRYAVTLKTDAGEAGGDVAVVDPQSGGDEQQLFERRFKALCE